jgi:hypothetical protein
MTDSDIDAAILAVTKPRWLKVARIVIDAEKRLGTFLQDGDESAKRVAKRIELLVDDGRLIAQGDVTKWRHSEVRLP